MESENNHLHLKTTTMLVFYAWVMTKDLQGYEVFQYLMSYEFDQNNFMSLSIHQQCIDLQYSSKQLIIV